MSFNVTMSNDFKVDVQTTNNRGSTPEEVAARCVNKIINISQNAIYMRQAIQSDRTTVYNAIRDAGQPKLAEYIRKM